ncbi:MAG: hypothetical protein KAX84_02190 [Burkholderiales bacterium]|nr:hypothetical protein [Burkholderiales bacterium]
MSPQVGPEIADQGLVIHGLASGCGKRIPRGKLHLTDGAKQDDVAKRFLDLRPMLSRGWGE